MVDPAGQNGVPLWLPPGETTVDFALYALSDDALLARPIGQRTAGLGRAGALRRRGLAARTRGKPRSTQSSPMPLSVTLPADVPTAPTSWKARTRATAPP
ncbi:MAG: hypothetical protein R2838_14720 [Caldilineaceae bacterium]